MLVSTETETHQILSNGQSVWVNAEDGCCIGRFTPSGVDIHLDGVQQMALGIECIDCFERGENFEQDWTRFLAGMKQHYDIEIEAMHKPTRTERMFLCPAIPSKKPV